MRFGVCTSLEHSAALKSAGWDYVEESVQSLLQGLLEDDQWQGASRAEGSALPIPCANLLVPASMKVTGPAVDAAQLRNYLSRVMRRAGRLGIEILVFGSGAARNIPEGFDHRTARRQLIDFARSAAEAAAAASVTVVIEPLNRRECNLINTVAEAMTYVREVDHPNFRCLVDSYHLWLEDEPLANVEAAMPHIKHVHLADKAGRVMPGRSGENDYRPLFEILKRSGYDGRISVEGNFPDVSEGGRDVLDFLKAL